VAGERHQDRLVRRRQHERRVLRGRGVQTPHHRKRATDKARDSALSYGSLIIERIRARLKFVARGLPVLRLPLLPDRIEIVLPHFDRSNYFVGASLGLVRDCLCTGGRGINVGHR
jgi:hypothetical protein